jgi:hypothetical protein
MKIIHLESRLLFVNLYVLVGRYAKAQQWGKQKFGDLFEDDPESLGKAATFRDEHHDGYAFVNVIYLANLRPGNAGDIGSLVHEASHVAWTLLEEYGIKDEETHCYLVQWIVEETLWRIRR